MLQRLQSLYLFLSFALYIALFSSPVFYIVENSISYSVYLNKINPALEGTVHGLLPLRIIISLVAVISFFSIFLFRKRKLQIRFVQIAQIFILASIISLGIYHYIYTHYGHQFHVRLTPFVVIPIISLFLNFLAIRGIRKDQALIDSLDRLR